MNELFNASPDLAAWAQNGLTLLGQTSLLLGAGLGMLRVLQKRRSVARDLLGRALLVSTLFGAALSLGLSLAPWNRPSALWNVSLTAPAPEADTSTVSRPVPSRAPFSAARRQPPASPPEKSVEKPSVSLAVRGDSFAPTLGEAAHQSVQPPAPQAGRWRGLVAVAAGLWLGGVLGLLLWWGACHQALRRLRRGAEAVQETETLATLRETCAALGVRVPLLLRHSGVNSPFLTGLLRPAIVLPSIEVQMEAEMLRAVLCHEAMHLKRRDLWWNTLGRIGCALLWPQPLLWILCRRLEQSSEEACDQAVLESGCPRQQYARVLLDWAERQTPRATERVAAIGVATGKSSLARRVQTILDTSQSRAQSVSKATRWLILGAALAAIVAMPFLVSGNAAPLEPEQGSKKGENAASGEKRALQQFEDLGEYRVFIRGVSGGVLQGVFIEQRRGENVSRMIVARTARQSAAGSRRWIWSDVAVYTFNEEKGLISEMRAKQVSAEENPALSAYLEQQSQALSQPLSPSQWQEVRRSFELPPKEIAAVEKWAAKQPRGAITGHVVDDEGQPVAGIKISTSLSHESIVRIVGKPEYGYLPWIWRYPFALPKNTRSLLTQTAVTASDGTYRIEGLAPQTYGLQIPSYEGMSRRSHEMKLPPYVQAMRRDVTVGGGQTTAAPDLTLTRGGLLHVRVVDKATGAALPDIVLIVLTRPNRWSMSYGIDTDASGELLFRLPAGRMRLSIAGRFSPRARAVAAISGDVDYSLRNIDISFDGGAFQPLRGTTDVEIARDRTRQALVRLERYVAPIPTPVPPAPKRMPPPQGKATLTGRVVDETGRGVAGVQVRALIQQKAQWKLMQGAGLANSNAETPNWRQKWASIDPVLSERAVTRADGSFRLNGLTTAPYNLVVAVAGGFGFKPPPNAVAVAVEGVWAREGQVVRRAAPLVLTRGALIEGRVVDKVSGLGLGGIIFGANGPHLPKTTDNVLEARSDAQGRFTFRVAPGTTSIYIAGPWNNNENFVFADNGKSAANVARIRTSRGLFAGSGNVEFEIDGGAPQFGLNLRSRSEGQIEIQTRKGQTRRLTLRLRRLVKKK